MPNKEWPAIVKRLRESGGRFEKGERVISDEWHAANLHCGDPAILCTGEQYGLGQGNYEIEGKHYKSKRGKVTCPQCIDIIKRWKEFRLS